MINSEPFLRILHIGGRGDTIGPGEALLQAIKDVELIVTDADVRADAKSIHGAVSKTLPYCLSDKVGRADFYINVNPTSSSLYRMDSSAAPFCRGEYVWGKICMVDRVVTVQTTTIDTLLTNGEFRPPHFLSLDAQGAELEIMEGAKGLFGGKDLVGVVTEVEFQPLYKGQPLFADQDLFLKSHCFQLGQLLNPEYWWPVPNYPKGKGFLVVAEALYLRSYRYFLHPVCLPALVRLMAVAKAFEMPSYSWEILRCVEQTWPQEWADFGKSAYLQEVIEELKEEYTVFKAKGWTWIK